MSFGETESDREAILKSIVGEDGYVRDKGGQLALTPTGQKIRGMEPTGKNIVIEDEGFSMRDFSDLAGIFLKLQVLSQVLLLVVVHHLELVLY